MIKTALALHHQVLPPTLHRPPESQARARADAVLPQHRDAALDPRRRRAAPRRRQRVRLRRDQRARGARGVRRPRRRRAPAGVGHRAFHPRGRVRGRAGRAGAELIAALERDHRVHARRSWRSRLSTRAGSRRGAAQAAGDRRRLARRPGSQAASGDRQARRPGLPADQDRQRHLLRVRAARPRRQGRVRVPGRGLAVPEHARRPLPALPRGARRVRPDRPPLRTTTRAATCSATGCSRGRRSPTPSASTPSDG